MAFNFKLPSFSLSRTKRTDPAADPTVSAPARPQREAVAPRPSGAAAKPAKRPLSKFAIPSFLAAYPVATQLQILGGTLVVVLLLDGALGWRDNREATNGTTYISASGEMRMLSQRISKAASLAIQGNQTAFSQLKDSRTKFADLLDKLSKGGEINGVSVPASPDAVSSELGTLESEWGKTLKNADKLLEMEKNLVSLGKDVATINNKNPQLLELAEQTASLKLQNGGGAREIVAANQLVMLTQRIAKNASALLVGDAIDPEVAFLLGKDTNNFRDVLNGLLHGSENLKAVSEGDTRAKLGELEAAFKEYQAAVGGILGSMQRLVVAKQSGAAIFRDSEKLLEQTSKLQDAYQSAFVTRSTNTALLTVLSLLALALIGLMAKLYLTDSTRRAEQAERQRQESEQANRSNQDAILRLMNELGDLADGDLTVTATVTEDITGAIADSINYTIEELRVLVGRINDAATRVTAATEIAKLNSSELLAAAEKQADEIQAAGRSVLDMARSMNQVSSNANRSAEVAQQSLSAAEKGTQAVQDSIRGMNEIREQIQGTSKRIKRLGESSQEIGEIVELISDITEQTNVLALNAAIQAASAGEAGRGFTVVAEEVQRLAERSAEATKQIAAIVKTIQTDTQDAVAAMEESTQGVVDGARKSDAAGQALAEIGDVSRQLAALIENISTATQGQAQSATQVANTMSGILRITEQTTAGTQRTAEAVGELAGLASELKGSVSGFKVS